MTPDETRPAIARLLMLAAAATTETDAATIEDALAVFDDRPSQRALVGALATAVLGKFPSGAPFLVVDDDDLDALHLLADASHNPTHLTAVLAHLDDSDLPGLAISLLAFWHQACERAAQIALYRLHIPEHAPQEP